MKTIYSQSCKLPNKCPDVNSAAPTSGFIEFCGYGCNGNRQKSTYSHVTKGEEIELKELFITRTVG